MIRGFILAALLIATPALAESLDTSPLRTSAMPVTTVAALPTCSAARQGQLYLVTDSLLPVALAIVAAGGAVVVPVVCNGTNWIVS